MSGDYTDGDYFPSEEDTMSTAAKSPRFKIRHRWVRGRKEYEKPVSPEYQVIEGRRIVGRFDFEHQAQAYIEKRERDGLAPKPKGKRK